MSVQQFKGTASYGAFSGRGQDIHTVRIPLIGYPNFRLGTDTTKDSRFVNCYFDPVKNPVTGETKYWLTKRPGLLPHIRPPAGNAVGRGLMRWKGDHYSVWGSKIYKNTTDLGVTLTTTTGRCGLSYTRPGAASQYVCVNDGVALYIIATDASVIVLNNVAITSSSVANPTVITTATAHGLATGNKVIIRNHTGSTPSINDTVYAITKTGANTFTIPVNVTVGGTGGTLGVFPATNTTDLMYKDGYMFTLKSDGTFWNCELDDPTTWDPTKFLTAQMLNSSGVGLANQTNVMFVFGDVSMQAFYNNANTTGSPMSNYESAMQQLGCASQGSIVSDEAQVTWVSQTRTGGYSVYTLNGITGLEEIGTPAINRLIFSEGAANISKIYAKMMRFGGRRCYILNLPTVSKRTFVYDYDSKLWVEFTNAAGDDVFPFIDSIQDLDDDGLEIQHPTNGWIYLLSPTTYKDDSVNFTVLARFGRLDLDTQNRKFVNRAELIGDKQSTTTNVGLQYSDDDYVTLSTARNMDMSTVRAFSKNLGNFRRRAWQVSYTGGNPLRLEALELKIRLGDD